MIPAAAFVAWFFAAEYETVVTAPAADHAAGERTASVELVTAPRASADDLLRLVPGLLVSRHGAEGKGRQLFLRGFDAGHGSDVEVTVDGIPWNETSNVHGHGYLDLQTLIPEAVRSISVEKGSHRLDQGPFATAGSVRFRLGLLADRRGGRVGYEIGSTGRHRVVATVAPAEGSSFAAAEAITDRGYGENRQTERAALLGRTVLFADGRGELAALAGLHAGRFGEPGVVPAALVARGEVGFYDSLSPDTTGQSARAFAALSWSRGGTRALLHGGARRLLLQENFTGYLLDDQRGDRLAQRHVAFGGGLRLQHEEAIGDRLVLTGGIDGHAERIDQGEDRIDAAHVAFAERRRLAASQASLAAHAGVRWLPLSFARLEGGVRGQAFAVDGSLRPVALPRASLMVYPGSALTLLLAHGRGVRPPEARAGAAATAISDTTDASVRFTGGAFSAALGGFAAFVQGEQIYDHLSATTLEVGDTRRLGVEAELTVRPLRWLALRADASAVDARFRDSGQAVPGAPSLLGALEAHVHTERGLLAGGRVLAVGARPLAYGARAGAVGVADVLVGWRGGWWDLSLTVENLLDARWREGEFNYPSWFDRSEARSALPRLHYAAGPPRTIRVGAGARF